MLGGTLVGQSFSGYPFSSFIVDIAHY